MSPSAFRCLTLRINGEERSIDVCDNTLLLDLVRDVLGLKSVREGCGVGACGSCTVLVDGVPVSSCLKLAATLPEECSITTLEGMSDGGELSPVQQAFLEAGAFQCAFCTSGMVLAVEALMSQKPRPTEEEASAYLNGNYCRCGSYPEILEAVRLLAKGTN